MSGIWQNDFKGNKIGVDAKKDQGITYLARRIANHIAATIAGEKPATLMNLSNSCGGLLDLWDEFNEDIFYGDNISHYELRREDTNVIVLFFCRHRIDELLYREEVSQFLFHLGYEVESVEGVLDILRGRYTPNSFPHEIGIFLGIPLRDVKAFMGLSSLQYTATSTGMWRVYGDSKLSLRIMTRYRRAENGIRRLLSLGEDPLRMLNGVRDRDLSSI